MDSTCLLPANWSLARLIDILFAIESGGRPKGGAKNVLEGIPSVGGEHLLYSGKYDFSQIRYVPRSYYESMAKGKINIGDVLVVKDGATTGKTTYVSETFPFKESAVNEHVFILRTCPEYFMPTYLCHWMRSLDGQRSVKDNFQGTAQGGINLSFFEKCILPIPPLSEQHRIVAKIEELFTRLDAGIEALKKIKAQLKTYRQAVLKHAFEGKLTAEWREAHRHELEPASVLLERIKQEKKKKLKGKYKELPPVDTSGLPVLPEGWEWATTDHLFWFVTSGSRGWAKYYSEDGPAFLRIGNLDHASISLDIRNIQHVNPPKGTEGTRTRVIPGDILVSITADVGMIALVPTVTKEAYINQHISLARSLSLFNRAYLAWYLASNDGGQKQFRKLQRGATKVGLGLDDIRSINVPFPPPVEQEEIVRQIERQFSIINDIEKTVGQSLLHANHLRQSILKRAFEGKLAPQDPTDEPADKLLERIKAERIKQNTKKRTATRKKSPQLEYA